MKGKILEGKKFNVQQSKWAQSLPEGAVEINWNAYHKKVVNKNKWSKAVYTKPINRDGVVNKSFGIISIETAEIWKAKNPPRKNSLLSASLVSVISSSHQRKHTHLRHTCEKCKGKSQHTRAVLTPLFNFLNYQAPLIVTQSHMKEKEKTKTSQATSSTLQRGRGISSFLSDDLSYKGSVMFLKKMKEKSHGSKCFL